VLRYRSKKKGECIMKSNMIFAVSLLAALSATTGFASAQYYHARTKPVQVDYNFEVRNGGQAPIYYRYVHTQAFPASSAFTPWTLLNKKNGFNSNVTNALLIQLSAHSNGQDPMTLLFESRETKGPRSRGPRTCFVTARVVHPEMKVVVTPQNVSEYARKTGQSMSEQRLPLDRNLTMEELNKYVILPADKVARYTTPRSAAAPTDVPGTSEGHKQAATPTDQPDEPEEPATSTEIHNPFGEFPESDSE